MTGVNKGEIASIDNATARIVPCNYQNKTTSKIVIPRFLRDNLKKGDEVAYIQFDDATGIILGRMDGEY